MAHFFISNLLFFEKTPGDAVYDSRKPCFTYKRHTPVEVS